MTAFHWTILLLSLLEVALLGVVTLLFVRLKRSEELLSRLRESQHGLLDKLALNEQMERELVSSFAERQQELTALDRRLRDRARELKGLLEQAETYSRSPGFLRQTVLSGHGRGKSVQDLAKATGLSTDEVEMILEQHRT